MEDEAISAKILQEALKNSGYTVVATVTSGAAAMECIEKKKPDLVLMDIKLEGELDGIEAAKVIHSKYDLPIVYISAYADEDILDRARITEPFGYILKPINKRELNMVIEMALYKHAAEQKIRKENEKARAILETAFFSLTATICRLMEYRDFYTAGHQRRVAELAVKVGKRLKLDQNSLNELYIGGMLHDIGKIGIPVEILTKTSSLSEIEIMLIKSHPIIGYDILKNAELPWNIKDIVLNHHEKLDGSGYPNGISGKDISRNVRIITACDVAEAMSTFRPYRAARMKMDVINELNSGKGIKYDADIVDIIMDLIHTGEFDPWE